MIRQVQALARVRRDALVGNAQDLWRALSDIVPETVLQAQADGTIFFCHRPPSGVCGRSLYGRHIAEFVTPVMRLPINDYLATLAPGDPPRRRLILADLPNGTHGWYLATCVPIARGGRIVAITIVARRLSPAPSASDARSPARWVSAVRSTVEPHHAQRLELLGLLASGLVHSFNNVLAIIGSASDLLRHALPDAHPMQGEVESIRHAVQHGSSITRQLLQLAKPHAPTAFRVDLNTIVGDVAQMARLFLDSQIALNVVLEPSGAPAFVDLWEMEQAILNLVINARDALPRGGTITISTARLTYTGDSAPSGCRLRGPVVRVQVTDDGTGIDEQLCARVFEPFFTTKQDRGSGLGLPTVRQIVKEANGCVELTSRSGSGTTVDLVLPDADAAEGCAA